jgi:uncharacterized phiE125 gp8 family phage protein
MMKPLAPVLVTPPAVLPVSLQEVKAQARVDGADEDGLILDHIRAAVAHLDGWSGILGRCLVTQVWNQSLDGFPADGTIRLPFPDVTAAVITYRDPAGQVQTLTTGWVLAADDAGSFVSLSEGASWPATAVRPDAVTVRMTAGYGTAAAVPAALKLAIRVKAAAMYQQREGEGAESPMFDALIAPYRRALV